MRVKMINVYKFMGCVSVRVGSAGWERRRPGKMDSLEDKAQRIIIRAWIYSHCLSLFTAFAFTYRVHVPFRLFYPFIRFVGCFVFGCFFTFVRRYIFCFYFIVCVSVRLPLKLYFVFHSDGVRHKESEDRLERRFKFRQQTFMFM